MKSSFPKGESGILATIFNLANTIIGNGTLAVPFAMLYSGWGGGLLLMSCAWVLSVVTIYFLTLSCELTGKSTYKDISQRVGGEVLSTLVQVSAMLYTTGTCIGYIIFLGGFLPYIIGNNSFFADRSFEITLICILLIYPLSFSRTLDALKWFSIGAVICVAYTAVVIVVESYTTYFAPDIKVFSITWNTFRGFPIYTGAFCCHYNVFRFYVELKNRSVKKLTCISLVSTSIAYIAYALVGVFGYKSMGKDVVGNVLISYPRSDKYILVACISFCFIMAASFPLVHFAQRSLLDTMLFDRWRESTTRRISESLIFVSLVILVAVVVKDIEIVLAYNGAIFGVIIVYVFPAYFVFKLTTGWRKILALITGILGIILGIVGVVLTTLDLCGVFK
ncbi:vacuolar amino acid transporter, putative [Entamoeba invadens IP1]|uniref:Vacuolar amino acid transporter, putative n=1 Tax=Entamoeba invadens IP1 TaxID=370355 RepID=A0A0A1UDE8_ENTIV|nr:vacuolar amino acid transporter, putative [Entamoeba invadens IP1]ELP94479.1 vacuolar amino acid transporter, putative [Entamoeba invadens IP1]|eukprot:XP_004261250.1 vacuolar amino acid transporter, putative [Entamoeba invadens IP1]